MEPDGQGNTVSRPAWLQTNAKSVVQPQPASLRPTPAQLQSLMLCSTRLARDGVGRTSRGTSRRIRGVPKAPIVPKATGAPARSRLLALWALLAAADLATHVICWAGSAVQIGCRGAVDPAGIGPVPPPSALRPRCGRGPASACDRGAAFGVVTQCGVRSNRHRLEPPCACVWPATRGTTATRRQPHSQRHRCRQQPPARPLRTGMRSCRAGKR